MTDQLTDGDVVAYLLRLPFAHKARLMREAGLAVACCPGCGCYVNAPWCEDIMGDDQCICTDNPDNVDEEAMELPIRTDQLHKVWREMTFREDDAS